MWDDTPLWMFNFFYHRDKMNSAIHCSPVRFSDLTLRSFMHLEEILVLKDQDITQEMAEVRSYLTKSSEG